MLHFFLLVLFWCTPELISLASACLLFLLPLSGVPLSNVSSPKAVSASPNLLPAAAVFKTSADPRLQHLPAPSSFHCSLGQMVDRHLQGRDSPWPYNILVVWEWAVQGPTRYASTRIVPDPENPQFSTRPPHELLGNMPFFTGLLFPATMFITALYCKRVGDVWLPQYHVSSYTEKCKMTFRCCSKPTGCDRAVFSATKMAAWLISNYLLCSSFCIQLISQVFTNQLQKFQNILAILWTISTSLSFSVKSMGLGLLIGLYEN